MSPSSSHLPSRRARGMSAIKPSRQSRTHSFSSVSTTSSSWSPSSIAPQQDTISGHWAEDAKCRSCAKCERPFTIVNRRHHCRICGHIFCHACSRTRMVLSTNLGEIPRRQRVCDPCAAHAQSSAISYDSDDGAHMDDIGYSNASSLGPLEEIDSFEPEPTPEPSVSFMLASMVGFAAAFWFLMDEVSYTNPAIWILLAGFCKNLHEFIASMANKRKNRKIVSQVVTPADVDVTALDNTMTGEDNVAPRQKQHDLIQLTPAQKAEIVENGEKATDKVIELSLITDGWTSEQSTYEDVVLHSRDGKPARIYKCETEFDLSPDELFDELFGRFETSSTWNITAAQNNILQPLSENTDLVHLVTAPALSGMITSRDFINSRTWRKYNGGYVIGSVCAGKNLLKTTKGITRGENGATGFIILPHETSPFKSRFVWILNCDIKGYFPGSLLKKGSISEMLCFVRNLRRHLAAAAGSDSTQ
ncbi:Steroidogenic acute regulatory protein, partial [Globisporangium splendens]